MNQGGNTPTYCTVTFDIENGLNASDVNPTFANPSDATRQVEAGQPVGTLPTLNYVSPTYIFDGWYTMPSKTGQQITDQTVIIDDITFYAVFVYAGSID